MADLIAAAITQAEVLTAAACRAAFGGGTPSREPAVLPRAVWGGDFADCFTAYPLAAARWLGRPPRETAEILAERMALEGTFFSSAEAGGPGYLNFHLAPHWYSAVLEDALRESPERYCGAPLSEEAALRLLLDAASGAPLAAYLPLRRDRGNPLYRLRYAIQRLSRVPDVPEDVKEFSFSASEQTCIKAIAACPTAPRGPEADAGRHSAACCLMALVDALRQYHTACRAEGASPRLCTLTAARRALESGAQVLGIPVK